MNEFEELNSYLINGLNVFQDLISYLEPKVIYRVYRVKGKKKRRYLFRHNRLLDFIPVKAICRSFSVVRDSLNKKED